MFRGGFRMGAIILSETYCTTAVVVCQAMEARAMTYAPTYKRYSRFYPKCRGNFLGGGIASCVARDVPMDQLMTKIDRTAMGDDNSKLIF